MRAKLRTPEQEQAAFHGLSTAEVAQQLGCSQAHVVDLIVKGDKGRRLRAVDISTGKKPLYRVTPEWLVEFLSVREVR